MAQHTRGQNVFLDTFFESSVRKLAHTLLTSLSHFLSLALCVCHALSHCPAVSRRQITLKVIPLFPLPQEWSDLCNGLLLEVERTEQRESQTGNYHQAAGFTTDPKLRPERAREYYSINIMYHSTKDTFHMIQYTLGTDIIEIRFTLKINCPVVCNLIE